MNSEKMHKCMKFGSVGILLVLLIFIPHFQANNPQISDNPERTSSLTTNYSNELRSSFDLTQLPYLDNISYVVDWLTENLIDETTLPVSPNDAENPMFYGSSNRIGDTIVDGNHYYEDFVVMFDGLLQLAYPDLTNQDLIDYYYRLQDFDFLNTSSEGGYFTYLNQDLSDNSTVIELNGNAQTILSFQDWLNIQDVSDDASDIIVDQWDTIKDLFWDNSYDTFYHSSSDENKHLVDQFVAAISGFSIYNAKIDSIANEAFTTADSVMDIIMNQGYNIFKNGYFQGIMQTDLSLAVNDRPYLSTNAYGIWSLIEWAFANPNLPEADFNERIAWAEEVYDTMKTNFWNETYSVYISETDIEFNLQDPNAYLKDNAEMLLATLKLFEATENLTYFDNFYEHYTGIESIFRDNANGNYFTEFDVLSEAINDEKDLTDHAYLLRSYSEIDSLAKMMTSSIDVNNSDILYGQGTDIQISSHYGLDYSIGSEDISTDIVGADAKIVLRHPNGTILIETSLPTTQNGEVNYNYTIDPLLDIGEYSIGIRLNYTGFETEYLEGSFTIASGINVDEVIVENSDIKAGTSVDFKLIVSSVYPTDVSFNLYVHGDRIQNKTLDEPVVLVQEDTTNITFSVLTSVAAEFGESEIIIDFMNNSVVFESISENINILSPITVEEIALDNPVYKSENLELNLKLKNDAEVEAPIKIEVSGKYLDDIVYQKTLAAELLDVISLNITLDPNTPIGYINYEIVIERTSDEQIVYSREFTTFVYSSLNIGNVDIPEVLPHGQEAKAIIDVENLLSVSQDITIEIYSDGKLVNSGEKTVLPGDNSIGFSFDKKLNPYALGSQNYEILIKNGDGEILYEESFVIDNNISGWSFLLGYALPILIPIVGMIVFKHLAMENKKRLG